MCDFSNIRVLVVDDSSIWRAAVIAQLASARLNVVDVAYDGVQAVFRARTTHPHLILMDVSLPHMNGIKATEAILEAVPAAKIVFLSAEDHPGIMRAALDAGGSGYVLKSRAGTQLIDVIKRVLGYPEKA